jgi:hypothetical protein
MRRNRHVEAQVARGLLVRGSCTRRNHQNDRDYRSTLLLGVVEQRSEQAAPRAVSGVTLTGLASYLKLLVQQSGRDSDMQRRFHWTVLWLGVSRTSRGGRVMRSIIHGPNISAIGGEFQAHLSMRCGSAPLRQKDSLQDAMAQEAMAEIKTIPADLASPITRRCCRRPCGTASLPLSPPSPSTPSRSGSCKAESPS